MLVRSKMPEPPLALSQGRMKRLWQTWRRHVHARRRRPSFANIKPVHLLCPKHPSNRTYNILCQGLHMTVGGENL